MQGVGLLIAADPSNGKLVVLAPITGGPADRAGIKPGDEVCLACWQVNSPQKPPLSAIRCKSEQHGADWYLMACTACTDAKQRVPLRASSHC